MVLNCIDTREAGAGPSENAKCPTDGYIQLYIFYIVEFLLQYNN